MDIEKRAVFKLFLFIFLPSLMLLASVMAAFAFSQFNTEIHKIRNEETSLIRVQAGAIRNELDMVTGDLLFLSKHNCLLQVLKEDDGMEGVVRNFKLLAEIRGCYDQIRYLDQSGLEKIRVNYDNGRAEQIPEKSHQLKSNRYYFKDTMSLGPDKVYVSPFDLNIEKGRLESPFKPMIRFGTPVFDNAGRPKGIVLINYLGKSLFTHLKRMTKDKYNHIMLANRDGYWLKGLSSEDEWGFMIQGRQSKTMENRFPEAWAAVLNSEAGQVSTPAGWFTFDTIRPLGRGQTTATGSSDPHGSSRTRLGPDDYFWKLISVVPESKLAGMRQAIFRRTLFPFVIITLLAAAGIWQLSRSVISRKQAWQTLETKVAERTLHLQTILQNAASAIISTDSNGKIRSFNRASETIFGWQAE
ncbi:MAG TPA: hypothetical protein DHV36_02120, partial [Desulfobacteraceae bacterium]|nr:hypothetical protein [Desulfobacteraceae bacterium]